MGGWSDGYFVLGDRIPAGRIHSSRVRRVIGDLLAALAILGVAFIVLLGLIKLLFWLMVDVPYAVQEARRDRERYEILKRAGYNPEGGNRGTGH